MSPYYDDGSVQIWHGSCLEFTGWLATDVLVTDPPYGIEHASRRVYRETANPAHWVHGGRTIAGDEDTELRDQALEMWGSRPALVFGSWRRPKPAGTHTVLVWDKGGNAGMGNLSVPWKPNWDEIYVIGQGFSGPRTTSVLSGYSMLSRASVGRSHPHEKPVRLLRDLLSKCPGVIADPFMGSGSTLRAAKDLGRRAIGVETDERYCEVAATRLAQGVLDFGA